LGLAQVHSLRYTVVKFGLRVSRLAATHLRVWLIAYGVLFATVGALRLNGQFHDAAVGLSGHRAAQLIASQDVLDADGPPLTGVSADGSFYPLAIDDDRGAFIYLPLVGYVLGTHDLDALLKWMFISFFAVVLLAYPLLLYELTGSVVAALLAPPIVLAHTEFLRTSGIYWLPAWANLLLLPPLMLVALRWKPSLIWTLVALAVVASFASSIRANAGLGFALGALIVVFVRMRPLPFALIGASLVLLAYLSIGTFAMQAVQRQRDDFVQQDFTSPYPNGHPFWHNAYLGLGYLKNPYGIRHQDPIAVAAAQRREPGVQFPTKRYEHILRGIYFRMLVHHPGYVLHLYAVKAEIVIGWAAKRFPGVVLLAPALLLFGRDRRRRQFHLLLMSGAALAGALSGVIVDPTASAQNLSGLYGWLLLLWLLSIGWCAAAVEPSIAKLVLETRARAAKKSSSPSLPWSARLLMRRTTLLVRRLAAWIAQGLKMINRRLKDALRSLLPARPALALGVVARALIVTVVVVGALLANITGNSDSAAGTYWGAHAALVARDAFGKGPVIGQWTFGRGLPPRWTAAVDAMKRNGPALWIRTSTGSYSLVL
jgi:hypothetical protein